VTEYDYDLLPEEKAEKFFSMYLEIDNPS